MSGGGTLVSFELKGGKEAAFRFLDALRVVDISNNLGDSKSLITHPATTTHSKVSAEERARLGISDGAVRLSVGLEDVEDLVEDIAAALDVVAGNPAPKKKPLARMMVEESVAPTPKKPAARAKAKPAKAEPAPAKAKPAKAAPKAKAAEPVASLAAAPEPDLFAEPAPRRKRG